VTCNDDDDDDGDGDRDDRVYWLEQQLQMRLNKFQNVVFGFEIFF
jgi:hypothetical protein